MNKLLEAAKERAAELEKEMSDAERNFRDATADKKKELRSVKAIIAKYEVKEN